MGKVTDQLFAENPEMIFTDREEARNLFWTKYDALGKDEFYVINYYGFGGIGKSWLCKNLRDSLQSGMHPVTRKKLHSKSIIFSFEELRESCGKVSVLEDLANKLENECSFRFPMFKYALYVYYRTKGLACNSPEIKKIQDNVIGAAILDVVSFVPVVGGIGSVVLKAMDSASVPIKELVTKNSKMIQKLDKMSVEDIADELVRIFAIELKACVVQEQNPLVIFLDTYEQLQNYIYETSSAKVSDEWLWSRIGLIRNIPNVLWVVAGQRRLDWAAQDCFWADEENLISREISEIADDDMIEDMLVNIGITEPEIIQVILEKTNGVPIHLSLCKDIYFNIKNEGGTPETSDFDMDYSELAERFIGGLSAELKDIIEFLACMEVWTEEDIVNLNLPADAYGQVLRLSFINDNRDFYSMHHRVQEVVYSKCSTINKRKYYAYACKLIDDEQCTIERRKHLVGKKIQIELEFLAAADDRSGIDRFFEENMKWLKVFQHDYNFFRNFMEQIYKHGEELTVPDNWARILGVYQLYYAMQQGEFAKAKGLINTHRLLVEQKSFDDDTRGLLFYALGAYAGNDSDDTARLRYLQECYYLWENSHSQKELLDVLLSLCKAYISTSKYGEAQKYANHILEISGGLSPDEHTFDIAIIHSSALLSLAKIEWQVGTEKKAFAYLKEAEEVLEEYKNLHNDGILYQLAAVYDQYRKLYRGIGRYDMELEYAKKDFDITQEAYRCLQSSKNYRAVMLVHFNFAKLSRDTQEKIAHYNQAIRIAEEIYLSQQSRNSLHEYVDLIICAADGTRGEQCLAYLEQAQRLVDQPMNFEVVWKDRYRLMRGYVLYYIHAELYDEATAKLEEVKEMLEKQKERLSEEDYLDYKSWNYREEGIIHRFGYQDDYKGILCYEKENAIEKKLYQDNPRYADGLSYSDSCRVLASAYRSVGLHEKAFRCAGEQLKIDDARAKEYPSRKTIMRYLDALRIVTEYYELRHDYKNALENYTIIFDSMKALYVQNKNYSDTIQLIRDADKLCSLLMRDKKYAEIQQMYEGVLRECEAFYNEFEGTEEEEFKVYGLGIGDTKFVIGKVLFLQNTDLERAWQYIQDSLDSATTSEENERLVFLSKIEALLYLKKVPVECLSREEGIRLLQE